MIQTPGNQEKIELSGTTLIDSLRSPQSEKYGEKMKKTVEKILIGDDKSNFNTIIDQFFSHKILREFFHNHPVCWIDLLRKLHKYRKNDREEGWYIEDEHIEEVYKTFLIRGRTNDIGSKLRKILPDVIIKNQALLEFASKQPSLLDSGGYSYIKIPKNKRPKATIGLIYAGLTQNIDACTYENADTYFTKVLPKVLQYLKEIFGIEPNLSFCRNIEQITKEIEKMFDSGRGDERENAFRVIQAFHAWSGIEQIETMHQDACAIVEKVPDFIQQKTGYVISDIDSVEQDGTTIYSGKLNFNGKKYAINWRVKSIKSILQKMWVTEEYTNIDAIRDMLGISIVWPDDAPENEKINIASVFLNLMPDYGYLLKNKGLFSDESLGEIQKNASNKGKLPIYSTSKRGNSTHKDFNNASYSGYIKINGINLGTEIQFSDEKSMLWKKIDDKKYKPKDAILGLIRGPKFGTPGQIFRLLNAKIDVATMQQLGVNNINGIIILLIEDNFILPFVSKDGDAILLSCKGKDDVFKKKFSKMELCQKGHPHYDNLIKYLSKINPLAL
ncbi:hypothetical protein HOO68_01705 [Candidatus Gracilibacteria bacterium]|nr:hypothetical protein [Candidatus Gracilibacteria bacterium]